MGSKRCIVFPGVTNDGLLPAEKVVTDFDGQNSATRHFSILEMWIGKVCQGHLVGGCAPENKSGSTARPSPQWVKEVFQHSENSEKTR